jgi:hypothetical protein
MLRVTSPNSFKTCYIADVKEELNLLTRKAPNRIGETRKIKAPEEYKIFIKKAIDELAKEGISQTYKNIQKKAFEIYKREKDDNTFNKYFGRIKSNLSPNEIKKIVDDEDFSYEN